MNLPPDTTVSWQGLSALATEAPVDRLEIEIRNEAGELLTEHSLEVPAGDELSFESPPGLKQRIQLTLFSGDRPLYRGTTQVDIISGQENTLDLFVFALGEARLHFLHPEGFDLDGIDIVLEPQREDIPEFSISPIDSAYEEFLATGNYVISLRGENALKIAGTSSFELLFNAQTDVAIQLVPLNYCSDLQSGDDFDDDGADCNNDCDDFDASLNHNDEDEDGQSSCDGDCDDNNAERFLENTEYPGDGIDNDCDQLEQCWVDNDGDGEGVLEPILSLELSCSAVGMAATALDCDDSDSNIFFGDHDNDGYIGCFGDCNDNDPAIHDGLAENCNTPFDDNCDGLVNAEDPLCQNCIDADNDGYCLGVDCNDDDPTLNRADLDGDRDSSCDGDCDDSDPNRSPSFYEICNDGIDNNCDGDIDGEDESCTGCIDVDGDGFCADSGPQPDCNDNDPDLNPQDADNDDLSSCDGDCDDGDFLIGLPIEHCADNRDNDCDGLVDLKDPDCLPPFVDEDNDGFTNSHPIECDDSPETGTWCLGECDEFFPDVDGDGAGAATGMRMTCPQEGWVGRYHDQASGLTIEVIDCDDTRHDVSPFATEICGDTQNTDEDCSGAIDDFDGDGDGFVAEGCGLGDDCNDSDPHILPIDIDGDGFTGCSPQVDCNPYDARANPSGFSVEICDGLDNDCNGTIDDLVPGDLDADSDGATDCEDNCRMVSNPGPTDLPQSITFRVMGALGAGNSMDLDFELNGQSVSTTPISFNNFAFLNTTLQSSDIVTHTEPSSPGWLPGWSGTGDTIRALRTSNAAQATLSWIELEFAFSNSELDYRFCLYGPCAQEFVQPIEQCIGTACPNDIQKTLPAARQPDSDDNGLGDACDVCDNEGIPCVGSCSYGNAADDADGDGYFNSSCTPSAEFLDPNDNLSYITAQTHGGGHESCAIRTLGSVPSNLDIDCQGFVHEGGTQNIHHFPTLLPGTANFVGKIDIPARLLDQGGIATGNPPPMVCTAGNLPVYYTRLKIRDPKMVFSTDISSFDRLEFCALGNSSTVFLETYNEANGALNPSGCLGSINSGECISLGANAAMVNSGTLNDPGSIIEIPIAIRAQQHVSASEADFITLKVLAIDDASSP